MRRRAAAFCLLAATAACTRPTLDPKPTLLPVKTNESILAAPQKLVYPPDLAKAGIGGVIVFQCAIEVDGSPTDCFIYTREGDERLIEPALQYAKSLIFTPATLNGMPIRVDVHRIEIKFTPQSP